MARESSSPRLPRLEANLNSDLLGVVKRRYVETFKGAAAAIHRRPECGLLTEKYPASTWSPSAPLSTSTRRGEVDVLHQRIWGLLKGVLADLA